MAKKKTIKDLIPDNKNQIGRPSKYSEPLVKRICDLIATTTKGIHTICKEHNDLPSVQTVFNWLNKEVYFLDQYTRAREAQAELLADEIIDIADNTTNDTLVVENESGGYKTANHEWISRSRLRVDARKWKASKLAPKKYGDKVDITTDGEKINQVFKIGYSKPDDEG